MGEIRLRPQEGAQTAFLASPADIVFYGGAAGGGKTWALIAEPLRHIGRRGFTAVIFRRNATQIFNPGGLWDEAAKIYPVFGGTPRLQRSEWIFPSGAYIRFAHLADEMTIYSYQGMQAAVLCCEVSTPILMADGSYKPLCDIKCGDMVKTLVGVHAITAIGEPEFKECVEIELPDGTKQIQTTDHALLTKQGWLSYEDITRLRSDKSDTSPLSTRCCILSKLFAARRASNLVFLPLRVARPLLTRPAHVAKQFALGIVRCYSVCAQRLFFVSTQSPCGGKSSRLSLRSSRAILPLALEIHRAGEQVRRLLREVRECLVRQGVCACMVLQGRGNCYELCTAKSRGREPQLLAHHSLKHLGQFLRSAAGTSLAAFRFGVAAYVLQQIRPLDLLNRCFSCCGRHGGLFHRRLRNAQGSTQQLNDVVVYNPVSRRGGLGRTPTRSRPSQFSFSHPYSGEVRTSECMFFDFAPCKITPIGKRKVRAITVAVENHYITMGGLVNKNCYDELTHFSEAQFVYMLSRNRSTCGVRPYIRATCNPDADSWVKRYIDWWIDAETGYPIKERSGAIRYMARVDNDIKFADSADELTAQYGAECMPKSITFIPATLYDNKILMDANPDYLANLKGLSKVERERLLYGNWKIQPTAGNNFRREWVKVIEPDELPKKMRLVRGWDLAGTPVTPESSDPDYTASVLMGRDDTTGIVYVIDGFSMRDTPGKVEDAIINIASQDGIATTVSLPQDPGQAGKAQAQALSKKLMRYHIVTSPESGDKEVRFRPFSAACEHGNVVFVRGSWNAEFFDYLEKFKTDNVHDDHADAMSRAYNTLMEGRAPMRINPAILHPRGPMLRR